MLSSYKLARWLHYFNVATVKVWVVHVADVSVDLDEAAALLKLILFLPVVGRARPRVLGPALQRAQSSSG